MKYLFSLVLVVSMGFSSYSQSLEQQLSGKRWGLKHYIEFGSAEQDTLFTVHNCINEFLQLNENKTYEFSSSKRQEQGRWVLQDSILILKNKRSRIRVMMYVRSISDNQLTLMEYGKGNHYMEVYFKCKNNDQSVSDTRQATDEVYIRGLLVGLHTQFQVKNSDTTELAALTPWIELGMARGKFSWNQTYFGWSAALEAAPWMNVYGANVSVWSHKHLAYGLNFNTYTDFKKINTGIKLMLGFSPRFLGDFGRKSHFIYAYNLFFLGEGQKPINGVYRHTLGFRMMIPLKTRKKEVRID